MLGIFIFLSFRAYLCHFFEIFPTDFFQTGQEGISRDGEGPQSSGYAEPILLSGETRGGAWGVGAAAESQRRHSLLVKTRKISSLFWAVLFTTFVSV